ncbi:Acetylcholinesterase [Strongyloides ratti]|uniref:Acetylcholinesterase n=1 Tax=Strongyloides ratti TaxID=34506 RepID=A0A090KR34_STRRB|nr:Acetylcholinesterase [Strongyloides ratti]CEF59839.1 Acetylcholinesterase [Strongyloides ratti]
MLIFLLSLLFITEIKSLCLDVKTKYGTLQGRKSRVSKEVVEFLGVPFAKPPIKGLRFREPKPLKENFYGKGFKATKHANACYQIIKKINFKGYDTWSPDKNKMSEDCLKLNMWVPKNVTGAVIVFIFGGQYIFGSPSVEYYDGSILAEKTGAIVVNLNYRLGVFGFAYYKGNEKGGIPGNLGLLDQQLGLTWIQENIKSFGGNPKKVTLFGQGSGSAMATAHLFSNNSKNLFNKIIALSGTIKNIWAVSRSDLVEENFRKLISKVKCDGGSLKDEVKCMQSLKADYLYTKAFYIKNSYQHVTTAPFIPVDKESVFFEVGKTASEASLFMAFMLNQTSYGCGINFKKSMKSRENQCLMDDWNYNNVINLLSYDHRITSEGKTKIIQEYKDIAKKSRDKAVRAISDFGFDCDIQAFATDMDKHFKGNVYSYYFKERSSSNPWPEWMGPMHRYDLLYLFGYPFKNPKYYKKSELKYEQSNSLRLMKIIGAFAFDGRIKNELDALEREFYGSSKQSKFEINEWNSSSFDKFSKCEFVKSVQEKFRIPNYPY